MLKRLASVKKKKKIGEKEDKEKLNVNDLQHPVLKKAKRRGTLTKEDEKNLPFDIKLKCGKARKTKGTQFSIFFVKKLDSHRFFIPAQTSVRVCGYPGNTKF